jgi:hypothetical protein
MATLNARPLAEIMQALETRLTALLWNGQPAFAEVRRFAADDLLAAFRALIAVQRRVCITLCAGVEWPSPGPGYEQPWLHHRRVARITLLCSDQVLSRETHALWGTASTPGAWRLAELAVEACCGLLLPNPGGVLVRPSAMLPLSVVDLRQNQPGRAVVSADLEAIGGTLTEPLASPGPIA